MGANQSANADGSSGAEDGSEKQAAQVKTCYYQLFGVERQASDEE